MAETNNGMIDKAISIIHNTQDGDLLSPTHLKLTELAVNGFLNDNGIEAFNKLYEEVMSGEYKQPFLHGVKHMTQDHEGYILFKGKEVEHYSSPWVHTLDAKCDLMMLQQKCLFLESKGIVPDMYNSVWCWNQDDEYGKYQKARLDVLTASGNNRIEFTEVIADNNNCRTATFFIPGSPDESKIYATDEYSDFKEYNSDNDNRGFYIQANTFTYGEGEIREATTEELQTILCCFDYLKDNKHLTEQSTHSYGLRDRNRFDEQDFSDLSQEQEDEYDEEI